VWLSIVLVCGMPLTLRAQETKKAEPAKAKAKAADADANANAGGDEGAAALEPPKQVSPQEIFKDEIAEKAMNNAFPQLSGGTPNPQLIREVKAMAGAAMGTDRTRIQQLVSGYAADLTSHTNINAVINPPPPEKLPPRGLAAQGARARHRGPARPDHDRAAGQQQ